MSFWEHEQNQLLTQINTYTIKSSDDMKEAFIGHNLFYEMICGD
jgi:hypothetical protein